MLDVYVDADACPVKQEVYRVARRYGLTVVLVANRMLRAPGGDWLRQVQVGKEPDAVDDWIAEHVGADDIVITADIPLAARCLKQGARPIGPSGRAFTEDNIGDVLATRDLLSELREDGIMLGGPPPFTKRDRSSFLQRLDETIQAIRRRGND